MTGLKRALALALIVGLLMSCLLTGCDRSQEMEGPDPDAVGIIRIGVFEPLTGANAAGGEMTADGIRLAHELYPEIMGMAVEVIFANNRSDPAVAASAVQGLINKEKVDIIIGSYGSALAMAGGPIAEANEVCIIGCSPTNPAVTLDNDYYFRVCFNDSFQGRVMASFAAQDLGAKTAAVIKDVQSEYSLGLADCFTEAFKAVNGDEAVVATVTYNAGDTDFSALLTEIQAPEPDIIFAPGSIAECTRLIVQARELGLTMPILGGDTWEAQELLEQVTALPDIYFSTHFTAEEPVTAISAVFTEAWRNTYPDQEISAFSALGFDTYILTKDAIERAGSLDKAAIRAALASTENFEGATGFITLDENGDASKTAIIKRVGDGQFEYVRKVEPADVAAMAETPPAEDASAEVRFIE